LEAVTARNLREGSVFCPILAREVGNVLLYLPGKDDNGEPQLFTERTISSARSGENFPGRTI
jgi:hypothetical protein